MKKDIEYNCKLISSLFGDIDDKIDKRVDQNSKLNSSSEKKATNENKFEFPHFLSPNNLKSLSCKEKVKSRK